MNYFDKEKTVDTKCFRENTETWDKRRNSAFFSLCSAMADWMLAMRPKGCWGWGFVSDWVGLRRWRVHVTAWTNRQHCFQKDGKMKAWCWRCVTVILTGEESGWYLSWRPQTMTGVAMATVASAVLQLAQHCLNAETSWTELLPVRVKIPFCPEGPFHFP